MTYSDVLLSLVATLDLPPDVDTPHLQIFNPARGAMETLTLSGPQGPAGAVGPAGPVGPQGPPGAVVPSATLLLKVERWDGVTAPAIPAGWAVDSELVTATTNTPSSPPNSLVYPSPPNQSLVPHATWQTPDTALGNVQVSATVRYAQLAQVTTELDAWLFARSPAVVTSAAFGSATYYAAGLSAGSGSVHFFLQKWVGGASTILATVGQGAFDDQNDYRLYLCCLGTAIMGRCQRLSDGYWLNSTGVFVADPSGMTWAAVLQDTAISGAGYAGLGYYGNTTGTPQIGADDWMIEAVSSF